MAKRGKSEVKRLSSAKIDKRLNVNKRSKVLKYILWALLFIVVILSIIIIFRQMTGNVSLSIELENEPNILRWFRALIGK